MPHCLQNIILYCLCWALALGLNIMILCTVIPNFNIWWKFAEHALATVLKYCYHSCDFACTHSVKQQDS